MKLWKNPGYVIIAFYLFGASIIAAQTSPSVNYQIRAKGFEGSNSSQLLVTADVPSSFETVEIQFQSPPQFVVEPSSLKFDPNPGKKIVGVNVRRIGDPPAGEYSILAHATAKPSGGGSPFAVDQEVTFVYTRRIQVRYYFILGLAGFVLGYLLRIVTGVLKNVPAPAPVLPNTQDGPITTFVRRHYYTVDFFVSLVLAFVVLLYLMREGHPPDSASAWYGALLTGIGLGFLTNNDLLARIKT
jgi:hypothetical protein